ncbi:Similar to ZKSCAN4: Zinc finger protein with KRAB and SCAN domains 4 (Homo sapiens) [Cotesia congregata]|uniref:Similar to ZKSCAN4: Zinc finger protein with KRAB and SCAN domains 4 (Homo sapiens) n=1 Tax=Cotesia congregata TaxID=51543 RepID=A0A8J2MMS4_COTCN|nr:Similar to ZKSCAN4: Zinc finger protein with KRAB and SCAN domains 4 (Homo sapiens) [Cotesia congregata]
MGFYSVASSRSEGSNSMVNLSEDREDLSQEERIQAQNMHQQQQQQNQGNQNTPDGPMRQSSSQQTTKEGSRAKPQPCKVCGKVLSSASSYYVHMNQFAIHIRTHTASTTYECNICGRTFVRDSYLIRHQNRVHRDLSQNNSNHNPSTPQSSGGATTPGTGFESPVCDLRYSEGPSSLDGLGGGKGISPEIATLAKHNSLHLPTDYLNIIKQCHGAV